MPTFTTTRDPVALHFETTEPQDEAAIRRPPVILCNGMTQTTQSWRSQARALSQYARVVCYDARGQGDTPLGAQPIALANHALDLIELCDHLQIERAHVVGFSHGARVALAMASAHGDRLDRLVLASATARPTALADTIVESWRRALRAGGLEVMSWVALPSILGPAYLEVHREMIDGIVRASTSRNTLEGVQALLDALIDDYPAVSALAEGVRAPTLVISGEQDLLVGREGARALAELCAGHHVQIEGCGHTLPIEAPKAFRDHVVAHLFDKEPTP